MYSECWTCSNHLHIRPPLESRAVNYSPCFGGGQKKWKPTGWTSEHEKSITLWPKLDSDAADAHNPLLATHWMACAAAAARMDVALISILTIAKTLSDGRWMGWDGMRRVWVAGWGWATYPQRQRITRAGLFFYHHFANKLQLIV